MVPLRWILLQLQEGLGLDNVKNGLEGMICAIYVKEGEFASVSAMIREGYVDARTRIFLQIMDNDWIKRYKKTAKRYQLLQYGPRACSHFTRDPH